MPKALIIGGAGQCGRAISHRLVMDGWDVRATTSRDLNQLLNESGVEWVHLARGSNQDLGPLVGEGTDVVVQVAAFGAESVDQLCRVGDAIGSAIFLSTLSVYSDAEGRSLDSASTLEGFPDWPVPIPEDWFTLAPGLSTYSSRKAAMEAAIRERAPWPVTIIRPGAIHGPYSSHLREWYFIKRVLDRRTQVILPFSGTSVFQPTATVNLAAMVALAARKPGNRTLNCGDDNPPTVVQISQLVDNLMNWTTERLLVDGMEPQPTVGNHPWGVPRPVIADISNARSQLGYSEESSYADAMEQTLAWALVACSKCDWRDVFPDLAGYPHDLFDYASEDRYLQGLTL